MKVVMSSVRLTGTIAKLFFALRVPSEGCAITGYYKLKESKVPKAAVGGFWSMVAI